ncbi:uncharacterized protein METZ01_LOCUS249560, partial [marine metagenome]
MGTEGQLPPFGPAFLRQVTPHKSVHLHILGGSE